MNSSCSCGCCEGIAIAAPQPTTNRPGLPTLSYRVGTHATFLETMIARLSSQDYPALATLKTRAPSDPSIALLDSWAVVADVLTFYQERIVNEGYLRTATERRSVLELARLLGYKLRPGVAATVYLAYTVDEDRSKTPPAPTETLIPAGSRSQSVPGPGQMPQFFETSDALDARSAWNDLSVRLTQPQIFTPPTTDFGTDITTCGSVYFAGTATNLQAGDTLMFVLDANNGDQTLRTVQSVANQPAQNCTEVILQPPALSPLAPAAGNNSLALVTEVVSNYVSDAQTLFTGGSIAAQAAALLSNPAPATPAGLLESVTASADKSGSTVAGMVQAVISKLSPLQETAVDRNFTRLAPWLGQMSDSLANLAQQLLAPPAAAAAGAVLPSKPILALVANNNLRKSVSSLTPLTTPASLASLTSPPSLQPRNSFRLARSASQALSLNSDMVPRMLGTFLPSAAPILYQAWANLEIPPATPIQIGAVRVKTGLFPGAYPGVPTSTRARNASITTSFEANSPTITNAWVGLAAADGSLPNIALDAVYSKILAGSWIMIDRPSFQGDAQFPGRTQTFHLVVSATTASMTTTDLGFTAKVTQLTLNPPWLNAGTGLSEQTGLLSGSVVYAQTEMFDLAEEPLDVDVSGNTIELDGAYDGLESGRWIIVSGERTDIPNVTGVIGCELVMILGVAQVTTSPNGATASIHTTLTLANALAYTYARNTMTLYGNVVKATHGQTNNETLGNGDGSQLFQTFTLKQKPLTFVPASNPEGASTTLEVYVNDVEWQEAGTLAGLGPKDRSYVTQTANDDSTSVIFGNGVEGARPPTGTGNVTAIYRNGIGQPGNVNANQISLLQTRPLNVNAVINPLPASGGADRDTLAQARRNTPLAVMSLDRLVSVQDYADFARTFAGIGKANAAKLSDGQLDLVHVTIAGAQDIPIDTTSDLYTNLVQALQINGDPHQSLQVALRTLKLLIISAQVEILADYLWEDVAADVRTTLIGAFSFDNRNLGQPVFQSEIICAMQAVAGVSYVNLQIFDSMAQDSITGSSAGLGSNLMLRHIVPASLARLNPSPANYPTDSILSAELVYLSATLPDTLILNQIPP